MLKAYRMRIALLVASSVWICARPALAGPCEDARVALFQWSQSAAEQTRLKVALQREIAALPRRILVGAYCRTLLEDLREKAQAKDVRLSIDDLIQHAIRYERFRLEAYLSSGVSPKRYFGFFDQQGDTATYERVLRETLEFAMPVVNEYGRAQTPAVQATAQEVAVTFLAEGGALLLTERQEELERIHPVLGIGLDSFVTGFSKHAALVQRLDGKLGTGLGKLTMNIAGRPILLRPMTFREAILGTAVMYLYEKGLAANLRERAGGTPLMVLPLAEQFVATSFVYNSGLLFSDERIAQVMKFATGEYLAGVNAANRGKRERLPVLSPEEGRKRLESGEPIAQQWTSWSAVYHVLQRYGAWVALSRFSTAFDDQGAFRPH